jgi:hypothetical protein
MLSFYQGGNVSSCAGQHTHFPAMLDNLEGLHYLHNCLGTTYRTDCNTLFAVTMRHEYDYIDRCV